MREMAEIVTIMLIQVIQLLVEGLKSRAFGRLVVAAWLTIRESKEALERKWKLYGES